DDCPCPLATTLPRGGHPCGRQPLAGALQPAPLQVPRCKWVCQRAAAAPASGAGLPCRLALAAIGRPLSGGLGRGLAMDGRPCMGADHGWPPLLLVAFAVKMQQECVE
ncbi:hypothetical protein BHM03_00054032, partial [Ensete ventricosum]